VRRLSGSAASARSFAPDDEQIPPSVTPPPSPSPSASPSPTPTPSPMPPDPRLGVGWELAVDGPVQATPALRLIRWRDRDGESDRFCRVVGSRLRAYHHLSDATPALCWGAVLAGPVDGALALSLDGGRVFIVTTAGTAWAFDDPPSCSGATVEAAWSR